MSVAYYRIEYHPAAPVDSRWSAVDDNRYDGAEDSKPPANIIGSTPAIINWARLGGVNVGAGLLNGNALSGFHIENVRSGGTTR